MLPGILAAIRAFLADRAYDAQERVLDLLQKAGIKIVIPPQSNRKEQREYDQDLYQARHLIENFFAKLKQYRAIATRYDKRAHNFLGAIHLAASVIWLYRDWETDRKSTRLNSSHSAKSRMPSSA